MLLFLGTVGGYVSWGTDKDHVFAWRTQDKCIHACMKPENSVGLNTWIQARNHYYL